ncbi:hypothetical protein B0J17DRAFT_424103 [Rhizoctonia solani]|nr:hypothetical protein B0J17DRAFT_424103 [Rhizoctonia solani]
MIEQLAAARDVLRSALDQYLSVCLFIDKSYVDGCLPASTFVGLMNGISDELSHAPIYEEALLRARLACASVRNRSSQIVPLNRLPADILIQIFQLVTIKQNCLKIDKNSEKKHKNPKYPSLLTQVCSRWRQVAMAAGTSGLILISPGIFLTRE